MAWQNQNKCNISSMYIYLKVVWRLTETRRASTSHATTHCLSIGHPPLAPSSGKAQHRGNTSRTRRNATIRRNRKRPCKMVIVISEALTDARSSTTCHQSHGSEHEQLRATDAHEPPSYPSDPVGRPRPITSHLTPANQSAEKGIDPK